MWNPWNPFERKRNFFDELKEYGLINDPFIEKKENLIDKCEIIDIANDEMKKIDSSEIDSEFKKVFSEEYTQNFINLIARKKCTTKDIKAYKEMLNDEDILDIRVEGTFLHIKTNKNIVPITLAHIMGIQEDYIQKVPINGKYNFYFIDCMKHSLQEESKEPFDIYDPDELVDILMDIGGDCICEDLLTTSKLFELVKKAINENWTDMPENISITVELEDKVVAIAFDQYIPDSKEVIGEALFLNPKIFIEVSTPLGTVLLIDTKRWYLDPDFGDEEWFH